MAQESSFPSTTDRIVGAIIGVCVCDALGGSVQFKPRGTFQPVTGFRYISQFDMPPGAWSDDGSLTLCLAQSLVDTGLKFSKLDAANKFVDWAYKGYYSSSDRAWDVGISTRHSLNIWYNAMRKSGSSTTPDPVRIQGHVDHELKHERFSGNGSLMRAAPIGIAMFKDPEDAAKAARAQSDITHPYSVCADACEIYTRVLVQIMSGEIDKYTLASSIDLSSISTTVLRDRLQRFRSLEDWKSLSEDDVKTSGWVVDTLEAALWAFFVTDDFKTGALRIVNFGDDSDTVGAVYGGLAGAYYGIGAIPEKWRADLLKNGLVEKVAADLAASASV